MQVVPADPSDKVKQDAGKKIASRLQEVLPYGQSTSLLIMSFLQDEQTL